MASRNGPFGALALTFSLSHVLPGDSWLLSGNESFQLDGIREPAPATSWCDKHGERRTNPPKDHVVANPLSEKRCEGNDGKSQKTEPLHAEVSHRGLACVSHASITISTSPSQSICSDPWMSRSHQWSARSCGDAPPSWLAAHRCRYDRRAGPVSIQRP
jgi:hypothetical protein